jgi:Plant transposon protein
MYPKWPAFLHSSSHPISEKEEFFGKAQEATRKDVEKAFGVLNAKRRIISYPSRYWSKTFMKDIMACCVILHNMNVELREQDCGENLEAHHGSKSVIESETALLWEPTDDSGACLIPPGSLASLCAASSFMQNLDQYYTTRRLIMNNLLDQRYHK